MKRPRSTSPVRALAVLAVALAAVMLVSGISPGATKFLTKQKAKKLFYTKAKADDRFVNVGEVEQLKVEGWHDVGAAGEPAFTTCFSPDGDHPCWRHFGSVHNNVAFFKDAFGVVHLKGIAQCWTDSQCDVGFRRTVFTLPPGYRPAAQEAFPVLRNDLLARVDVAMDGQVVVRSSPVNEADWVSLDGIMFRAA